MSAAAHCYAALRDALHDLDKVSARIIKHGNDDFACWRRFLSELDVQRLKPIKLSFDVVYLERREGNSVFF